MKPCVRTVMMCDTATLFTLFYSISSIFFSIVSSLRNQKALTAESTNVGLLLIVKMTMLDDVVLCVML